MFFRNEEEGRYSASTPDDPHFSRDQYIVERAITGEAGNAGEELEWRYARHPERLLFPHLAAYVMGLPAEIGDRDDLNLETLLQYESRAEPYLVTLELLKFGNGRAKEILRKNRPIVRSIAAQLRAMDRLDGDYLSKLLRDVLVANE